MESPGTTRLKKVMGTTSDVSTPPRQTSANLRPAVPAGTRVYFLRFLQETFTFRFSYFGAAAVEKLRGHEAVHEALGHAF